MIVAAHVNVNPHVEVIGQTWSLRLKAEPWRMPSGYGTWLVTFVSVDRGYVERDRTFTPILPLDATYVPGQKRHPCARR